MAALIGLDDDKLPELVERASANGVFGVANRNAPGQVVVSGERAAVEASAGVPTA
jgi:[acyl-carrier-protein] S-malonyltransferase